MRECPVPPFGRRLTPPTDPHPPPSSLAQASDETAADAAPPADAPEDPVTTSMTISYALPDGTEHASSAPCPVTRERAGAVPLEWSGPDAGHALTIDETSLRALASDPRVAVTFTREGDFPVDPDTGERAADRGPDVVSVVAVELASLILGTSSVAVARFDADPNADANPMPPALAGFQTAVFAVRSRPLDADASSDATPPPPFIPAGLAASLEPFAVTIEVAERLPDAPATWRQMDESCEPVAAHFRWAGFPASSAPSTSGSRAWSDPVPGTYPPARTRTCRFGRSTMLFGADIPDGGGLRKWLASTPLEVRVHDRTAPPEPIVMPGPAPKKPEEGEEGAEGKGTADEGEGTADEGEGTAATADDGDGDAEPPPAEIPHADAYATATFDLRDLAAGASPPRRLELESPLRPGASRPLARDHDWRTRPGRYVDVDATLRVTVETAVTPRVTEEEVRPYVRVSLSFPYADASLFREISAAVRETNAAALGIEGTPDEVTFALARRELTPAEIVDPALGVLTGYHVADGASRHIAVEGTPDAMTRVVAIARRVAGRAASKSSSSSSSSSDRNLDHRSNFHALVNTELTYASRLWGALGADLWPVKLSRRLATLAADASSRAGDGVSADVRDAVDRLRALATIRWARHAEEWRLFPRATHLTALDRRFGAELTNEDLTGEIESARRAARTAAEKEAAAEAEREALRAAAAAAAEAEALRVAARRRRFKPDLCMSNPGYLADLATRRRVRVRRDVTRERVDALRALERTVGEEKRRAWATWNVTRCSRADALAIAAKEKEEVEDETAREREHGRARDAAGDGSSSSSRRRFRASPSRPSRDFPGSDVHPAPFAWPVAPTAAEQRAHPKRPHDYRLAQLEEPWEEEHAYPRFEKGFFAASRAGGPGLRGPGPGRRRRGEKPGGEKSRPPFKVEASASSGVFGRPEYFTTVHLYGDDLIAERRAAAAAERAEWRSKIVVDDPRGARAGLPIRKEPSQADRHRSILHGPARKLGVTGKYVRGAESPPPVSMYLDEPPSTALGSTNLEELFTTSLRADMSDAARFTAGPGRDFAKSGLSTKSLVHTGRRGEVGKVAKPAAARG